MDANYIKVLILEALARHDFNGFITHEGEVDARVDTGARADNIPVVILRFLDPNGVESAIYIEDLEAWDEQA